MPSIINISYAAAEQGAYPHKDPSVLIQITDPGTKAPSTPHKYVSKHHFQFHDAESLEGEIGFPYAPPRLISDQDAKQIVDILTNALDNGYNVVVHCHAGLCRSGAVCEVGVMMGFEDMHRIRMPNVLVKNKLMKQLGWTYG